MKTQTMPEDYYKTLGVSKTATPEEIAKAYRKLARKHHPDLNPDDKRAKSRFQEIQSAYDCLNEPEKRSMYDRFGHGYENYRNAPQPGPGGSRSGPQWTGGGDPSGVDFGQAFGGGTGGIDLGDLFRQFTGGGFGQGEPPAGRSRRSSARSTPQADQEADITIPFATAVVGGETEIKVQHGDGKLESLRVKIPAGVQDGKKIRLRGQASSSGGDLLLRVHISPHPSYKMNGNDLEVKLPVTLHEAAAGAKIDVPTPAGIVSVKVPANSQSGRRLRIKGQGIKPASGKLGDLYIELQIRLPETLSAASLEKLASIDAEYQSDVRREVTW